MTPDCRPTMPLMLLLAAFATGVGLVQVRAELPSPSWAPLAVAVLAIAGALSRSVCDRPWRVAALLAAAAALAGHGYAAWRAELRLADALPAEAEGRDLVVVGIVDDLPRRGEHGVRFAFAIEHVETHGVHVPSRVSLAWPSGGGANAVANSDLSADVHAGERWRLAVRLRRPHGNANPGGFDLEAWLLERNLRATGYVRENTANRRVDAFAGRSMDVVQRARESIRQHALAALAGRAHAPVLVALAIGDQSGLSERQWTVFNRTGTGHLISVSGLHVTGFALLAGGLAFALARRCVGLTSRVAARKVGAIVGVAASFAYMLVAGAEIPAQRTFLMLAVTALGVWLARPGTGIVVWSWALAIVLAFDPWAVVAPGFWLSFFAVGLLIYVAAGRRGERPGTGRIVRWRQSLGEAVHAQAAITLGLVPLSLALFCQVSLIGPIANAVAIPVVTFAIVPLALAASVLPYDAPWTLAHGVLAPLMELLERLADLPGAAWAQHQPPDWAVVVGIAAVALCLAPRGVPGRWLGALALAPLAAVVPPPPPEGGFRVVVLDVGQGTAVVVRTARHALLYDAGPRWTDAADAGGRIVAPYLRAAGIRTLDAMIVSHRDLDHAGGALSVLASVPVGWVLSSLEDDHPILARQRERGLDLRCVDGQRWTWDGVAFEVLFPARAHYDDRWRKTNDLSCVLRVSAPGAGALLAGDIEAVSEIELVTTRREALRADVLVVPHHGSRTSSTSSFVEAVGATHAVFSVGYRNRFGHPRADIVGRYLARQAAIHRTDASGALTFELGPYATGPPAAARAQSARYWHEPP